MKDPHPRRLLSPRQTGTIDHTKLSQMNHYSDLNHYELVLPGFKLHLNRITLYVFKVLCYLSILLHKSVFALLLQCNIPLCDTITIYSSYCWWIFECIWSGLLWIQAVTSILTYVSWQHKNLEVKLLGHSMYIWMNLVDIAQQFSKVVGLIPSYKQWKSEYHCSTPPSTLDSVSFSFQSSWWVSSSISLCSLDLYFSHN